MHNECDVTDKIPAKNMEHCISAWIPEPWVDTVLSTINQMIEIDPDVQIHQIKSKFRQLRLYFHSDTKAEEMDKLVSLAEDEIERINKS